MLHLLSPKALRYVTAVASTGSVQAAAREVAISASAIDRQILMLEEELGVPLFERQPRGMRLKAAGELLLALSQRWKQDLNRTLSDIKQLQGVSHGQLRLAAMDSHANGLLPDFIQTVAARHPGVVLEVDVVSTDEATRLLLAGEVDLALAFNLRAQREVHLLWSTELPLGCAMAPGHALAQTRPLSFKDVVAWPLAVQSRALAIRRYLERRHGWLLQEARPPLVTNSLQLVKSLVRQWHLPEHRESIDLLDAVLMERLVVRLPAPHRDAIRWCYVFGGNPIKFAGRLRVSKEMLHRYVEDGRKILTRELNHSRNGVLTGGVS